jgi:hypothetical protein
MDNLNVSRVTWRKSSRSGQNGNCVEVAEAESHIAVRDSKAPDIGHLTFCAQAWAAFMTEARAGRYDR